MANTVIQFKRTNVPQSVPNTTDPSNTQYIVAGELALNMADGILYTSNGSADGLIPVGAKQKTFQTTTVTVSDTFTIGDIADQLLKANSTTMLAGNNSVNTTVNTSSVSVQNSTSNVTISAQRIFAGNTVSNAQFNLIGGSADLTIINFNYDSVKGTITFETAEPHNLVAPVTGIFVTLSNLTGGAAGFNGRWPISDIPTTHQFMITGLTLNGTVAPAPSTSVSRVNGVAILYTVSPHGFTPGSPIRVSGVGYDQESTLSFDGNWTVAEPTNPASTTIYYHDHPVVSVSPTSIYKSAGDHFVTYYVPDGHNLQQDWYVVSKSYPGNITTPLVQTSTINAVAFAVLDYAGSDFSTKAVNGKSIYMLIDPNDTTRKTFPIGATPKVSAVSSTGTYEDIYNRTITHAFLDPALIRGATFGDRVIITTDAEIYGFSGDFIVSGFNGAWAFLNDKQIPFLQITKTQYDSAVQSLGISGTAPAYNQYKCFYLNIASLRSVEAIPSLTLLTPYSDTGASAIVRMPQDLGIVGSAIAGQVWADPYVVRVDNLSTSPTVDNWPDTSWGPSGGFKSGLQGAGLINQTVDWVGNWTQAGTQPGTLPGLGGANPEITIGPFPADAINQFTVDGYILIYNAPGMFYNISGANIGIWKVIDVNTSTNKIKIDYSNKMPAGTGNQNGVWYWNFGSRSNIYSPALNGAGFQPFVGLTNPIQLTTEYSRAYVAPTKVISVIDAQRFTMPFVSNYETPATVYGGPSNMVDLLPYSYITRNTDVSARSPQGLVAKVVFSGAGSTTGQVHIDYPSFVEVTNSSAAIMITPSTIYNGNSTANLFSNSSTLAISSTTDNLKLQPGGFSIQRYDDHGLYDPSQPYLFVNTSVLQFGTTGKTSTIQAGDGGGIKNINNLEIGTPGIADVYIDDFSITINASGNQTRILSGSAVFGGDISIGGGLMDSAGTYGTAGQFLSTDGVNALWVSSSFDYAADQNFTGDVTVTGKFSPKLIDVLDEYSNELRISGDTTSYTANTLEKLTISANTFVMVSNDTFSNAIVINSTSLSIGNSTVNSTINSTAFKGTSNNALYLGGSAAADYALKTDVISVNVDSTYSWTNVHTFNNTVVITKTLTANGSNGTSGQVLITAGTGGNVYWASVGGTGGIGSVTSVASGNGLISNTGSAITGEGTLYVKANTGVVANADGVFVNANYIATITANNANYFGGLAGNTGSNGQILISTGSAIQWADKYTQGSLPPDHPKYGDIWYYTDMEKLFMWVNDGAGEYWYDFLPPSS
jgi:hypothetical protein